MTTTYEDATTWRDLADQLTPQQRAELEYCEREGIPPSLSEPQHHLNAARAMISHNIAQTLCADIATPPEAVRVYDWENWGDGYGRMFVISTKGTGEASADVLGVQHDDGRIERFITVKPQGDEAISAEQARRFAAVLLAAADELDRLQ